MFYDGPQHTDPAYIAEKTAKRISALGPDHVVVPLGLDPGVEDYMKIDQLTAAWDVLLDELSDAAGRVQLERRHRP